ncbi:AraC family transcriptional regulator [Streptosporangium carneum]|uniref:AraC family transcriptional regulator n=1 Tax=Streptosporangium carneum TaxID=47481 RepID=A0A9W6I2P0_9ACTN|nr:AraC family transcriptional regulator [Streptosporangium carneum]
MFADRTALGLPAFDFAVCAEEPGPMRTDLGLSLHVEFGLDHLAKADLIILMPYGEESPPPFSPAVVTALRSAHRHGAIIAGFCTGSFLLAATGLLDGRRATTHWCLAKDLAAAYPEVTVVADALYIDEGSVITGAGAASSVDMCLYLLRREYGASVANAVAREMVVAPHRDGGQAQYIARPVPADDDERFTSAIDWARSNLDEPMSVNDLATHALMSPRTFTRRFRDTMGTTPHSWLLSQRLNHAEELLETTGLQIEEIAHRVGYNSVAVFREQFVKRRGLSPRAYRQRFGHHDDMAARAPREQKSAGRVQEKPGRLHDRRGPVCRGG